MLDRPLRRQKTSRPLGARGLKLAVTPERGAAGQVAPPRGAWIETLELKAELPSA